METFFGKRSLLINIKIKAVMNKNIFFIRDISQRGFMGTIADDYNRSIAENRRRSTETYRRVMSTWPSMMVGTAEGDLPKLFSPALLA